VIDLIILNICKNYHCNSNNIVVSSTVGQRKRAKQKWLLMPYASQKFNHGRKSRLQEVNPVGKKCLKQKELD